jgi:mono/diheme cytochrome c family protein
MNLWRLGGVALAVVAAWAGLTAAAEPTAAERGEKALLTRNFTPPSIKLGTYKDLWRVWDRDAKEAPADYREAVARRYGLHIPPYENGAYPMGLREGSGLLTLGKGLATDCMICHGGSIAGHNYVGLGNSTLDFQSFIEDVAAAEGRELKGAFTSCNVRGTVEAGAMSVFLFSLRKPDLTLQEKPLDLGLKDDACEDVPAWWLLKKKKTMYYHGGSDARSVRSLMQFSLNPLNGPAFFEKEEPTFRDVQAFLLSIQPPKYPFAIDRERAKQGEQVFLDYCSRCHGTYGEKWTYPNKIIPLEDIGTDPKRYQSLSHEFAEHYNRTWFAREKPGWLADDYVGVETGGYQAPPLDGIWATAPYFHNGCAPTVHDVLDSKHRPKLFTRSYRTDKEAYDPEKLGWKVEGLEKGPDPKLPGVERRKVYDTTQPGRSNGGHPFGDKLTEEERMAVIEYLKTL